MSSGYKAPFVQLFRGDGSHVDLRAVSGCNVGMAEQDDPPGGGFSDDDDSDGEHTVIDTEWADKFKEWEAKRAEAKEDSEAEPPPVPDESGPFTPASPSSAETVAELHLGISPESVVKAVGGPDEPSEEADKEVFAPIFPDQAQLDAEPVSPGPARGDMTDDWGTSDSLSGAWEVVSTDDESDDEANDATLYHRQHTGLIDHTSQPMQSTGARLVFSTGPLEGQEFPIMEGIITVGRSASHDLTLDDPSVSRVHAYLEARGSTYTVTDQNSNNGTFVNGEAVTEAEVRSGDELTFGTITCRLLELGDVFKGLDSSGDSVLPSTEPSWLESIRERPYFLATMASVFMVAVTIAIAAVVVLSRVEVEGPSVKSDKVFRYFLAGVEAFKDHRWEDSEKQLQILKGLDPSHAKTLQYLDAVGEERRAEGQLELAQASRQRGELGRARAQAGAALGSIFFSEKARDLLESINQELEVRQMRARTSIEAGRYAEALELLDEVEKAEAGRQGVQGLLTFVRSLMATEDAVEVKVRALSPAAAPSPEPNPSSEAELAPPKEGLSGLRPGPLGEAQRLFIAGQIDGALEVLERDGTELDAYMLAEKIQKFKANFATAEAEHRAKRARMALRLLDELVVLEERIAGRPTAFRPKLRRKQADMHYITAIESIQGGQLLVGYKRLAMALKMTPNHGPAKRQVENLEGRLDALLLEGLERTESEPAQARDRFELVVALAPPGTDLAKRARAALAGLGKR